MDIQSTLGWIGDKVGELATKAIQFLSQVGIGLTTTQGKVVSFIITLVLLYLVIKVIEIPKKIIKWLVVILLVILAVSIGLSLAPIS